MTDNTKSLECLINFFDPSFDSALGGQCEKRIHVHQPFRLSSYCCIIECNFVFTFGLLVFYFISENDNSHHISWWISNTVLLFRNLAFCLDTNLTFSTISVLNWRRKYSLQYSCLENPRDRGAWWAAIYGIAQSWMRLKGLSSSSSCAKLFQPCLTLCRHIWLFATLWAVAHQSLSTWFSRQEYWSGLPFPSPEYLPNPII